MRRLLNYGKIEHSPWVSYAARLALLCTGAGQAHGNARAYNNFAGIWPNVLIAPRRGATVADDKRKTDYGDRDQININEPHEVEYWAGRWNVSQDILLQAIKKVVPKIRDIAPELWKLV